MVNTTSIDRFFLIVLTVALLLGQLARITFLPGVQFYLLEALVGIHVVVLLILKYRLKNNFKLSVPVKVAIVWFVLAGSVLLVTMFGYSTGENIQSFLYLVRVAVFALYAYLLSTSVRHHHDLVNKMLIMVVPTLCLLQYFLLPDLRFLQQYGWDPHMYRAVGLLLDPPIVGSVLGIFFFTALKKKLYLGLMLNYFAILFLYSRSTYLAVGFLTFVYLLLHKKWLYSVFWVFVFAVSISLAPLTISPKIELESAKIARTSTIMSRRVEMMTGIRAWLSSPIVGIGYNRVPSFKKRNPSVYGEIVTTSHSISAFHSFWITQLATTGIVGVSILGYWMYLLIQKNNNLLFLFGVPAIIGLLDNVFFHPFVMVLLIIFVSSRSLGTSDKDPSI